MTVPLSLVHLPVLAFSIPLHKPVPRVWLIAFDGLLVPTRYAGSILLPDVPAVETAVSAYCIIP